MERDDLARGFAAERTAALQPADSLSAKMDPPPPLAPGAEDVAPDEIAAAAHRLLSRLAVRSSPLTPPTHRLYSLSRLTRCSDAKVYEFEGHI